jgi:predicted transcriptional regulator YdeE
VCEQSIISALKIIAEELEISEFEYVQFSKGLKDSEMQAAYDKIYKKIFPPDA